MENDGQQTAISCFKTPDVNDSVDEERRRLEAEEAEVIETGLAEKLGTAFQDVEWEDDDDEDEEEGTEHIGRPSVIRSSLVPDPGLRVDQIIKSDTELDKLRALYRARGDRIRHLEDELAQIKSATESRSAETAERMHAASVDYDRVVDEAANTKRMLEAALEMRRQAETQLKDVRSQVDELLQDKNQIELALNDERIRSALLQEKLDTFLQSDTVTKAKRHHDEVVQALQSKHAKQLDSIQTKVVTLESDRDRLKADNERLLCQVEAQQADHRQAADDQRQLVEALRRQLNAAPSQKAVECCVRCQDAAEEEAKLQAKVSELRKENVELRSELARSQLTEAVSTEQDSLETNRQELDSLHTEAERLRMSLTRSETAKTEAQEAQRQLQAEMDSLVQRWKGEIENIKRNHGIEREQLGIVQQKYGALKDKSRDFQSRARRREAELKKYIEDLRASFVDYQTKLQAAFSTRQNEMEQDVMSLKTLFADEVRRIRCDKAKRVEKMDDVNSESLLRLELSKAKMAMHQRLSNEVT